MRTRRWTALHRARSGRTRGEDAPRARFRAGVRAARRSHRLSGAGPGVGPRRHARRVDDRGGRVCHRCRRSRGVRARHPHRSRRRLRRSAARRVTAGSEHRHRGGRGPRAHSGHRGGARTHDRHGLSTRTPSVRASRRLPRRRVGGRGDHRCVVNARRGTLRTRRPVLVVACAHGVSPRQRHRRRRCCRWSHQYGVPDRIGVRRRAEHPCAVTLRTHGAGRRGAGWP